MNHLAADNHILMINSEVHWHKDVISNQVTMRLNRFVIIFWIAIRNRRAWKFKTFLPHYVHGKKCIDLFALLSWHVARSATCLDRRANRSMHHFPWTVRVGPKSGGACAPPASPFQHACCQFFFSKYRSYVHRMLVRFQFSNSETLSFTILSIKTQHWRAHVWLYLETQNM